MARRDICHQSAHLRSSHQRRHHGLRAVRHFSRPALSSGRRRVALTMATVGGDSSGGEGE